VPLLTIGVLAFVPFLRLALVRRRPRDWVVFGSYLAADVAAAVLVSVTSVDSAGNALAGGLLLLLAGGGTVHTLVAFRPGAGGLDAPPGDPNRLAVKNAEDRMRLRREARKIHGDSPVLAGELKIGRPDLPHSYDDGGLVDVNHVPAAILVSHLGLTQAEAAAVIDARDRLGSFASADELSAYTELTPSQVDGLRDWLIFGLAGGRPAPRMARVMTARAGQRSLRTTMRTASAGRTAGSIDWADAFQDRSSRAAGGDAEQGEARRGAATCGA
jgi:hypothetical protein